jgi:hypothetical protein
MYYSIMGILVSVLTLETVLSWHRRVCQSKHSKWNEKEVSVAAHVNESHPERAFTSIANTEQEEMLSFLCTSCTKDTLQFYQWLLYKHVA